MRVVIFCSMTACCLIAAGQDDARISQAEKFVPVLQAEIEPLKNAAAIDASPESSIRRLQVFATLSEANSLEGRFTADLETVRQAGDSIRIGRTNLQGLKFYSDGVRLDVGCDASGALVPLKQPESGVVTAEWRSSGIRSGTASVFQLSLPPSAICVMKLTANASVSVSSPNAMLTSKSLSKDSVEWTIRPDNNRQLTISCNRKSEAAAATQNSLSITADASIHADEVLIDWSVKLTATTPPANLTFQLTESCDVKSVRILGETPTEWTFDAETSRLNVALPDSPDLPELTVRALRKKTSTGKVRLPFLVPGPGAGSAILLLRSSSMRVSVPPTSILTDVSLKGVEEGAVSYASDGTQTLNLVQFAAPASAELSLAPSQAAIHDASVAVMDPESLPGIVTIYLKIEAKSGQLGEVKWQVPTAWRVIEVKEVGTQLPLLFRMNSGTVAQDSATLSAYLRSPVSVGMSQRLEVTLQSAFSDPGIVLQPPSLSNPDYLRELDLVVTHDSTFRPGPEFVSRRAEDTSWLPDSVLVDAAIFERRFGSPDAEVINPASEALFATIDYSVARRRDIIDESIRLRLRRRGGLPARIPLSVTPGVTLAVSAESLTQPPPVLNRISSSVENWGLELPTSAELPEEISVLLVASRKFQSPMNAAIVVVKGAQQSGGSIQAPGRDVGFELELSGEKLVAGEATTYPEKPPTDFVLMETERETTEQSISGNVFQILSRMTQSEIAVESVARLQVESIDSNGFLRLPIAAGYTVSVVVNGRPCFGTVESSTLTIPLDRRHPTNTVDLHFTAQSTTALHAPIELLPIRTSASESRIKAFALLPPNTEMRFSDQAEQSVQPRSADSVLSVLSSTFPSAGTVPLAEEFVSFMSRWNAAMLSSSNAVAIDSAASLPVVSISLRDTTFDVPFTVILALLLGGLWAFVCRFLKLGVRVPALATTIAGAGAMMFDAASGVWFDAAIIGTLGYMLLKMIQIAWLTLPQRSVRLLKIRSSVAAILVLSLVFRSTGASADESDENLIAERSGAEVLVIRSEMQVGFESLQLMRGEVRCTIAVRPDTESAITLPLKDLTLVECFVDGESVIPRKIGDGRTQIILAPSLAGENVETDKTEPEDSSRDTDGWQRRSILYRVRMVPRAATLGHRIAIPYPPSPEMNLTLSDPTGMITASSVSDDLIGICTDDNTWNFNVVYNRDQIDLGFRIRGSVSQEAITQQCRVNCDVEVSPQTVRLRSAFSVTPGTSSADRVSISTDARYRVTGVSSENGESLPWSTADGQLVVLVSPNASGQQVFTVRQSAETSLSLKKRIFLNQLRTVNGLPADSVMLSVITTDRFMVEAVSFMTDAESAPKTAGEISVAPPFTDIVVPAETSQAAFVLSPRTSGREASIQQVAVVSDSHISWNGLCRLDVTGRPIYRQEIQVPNELRVSSFTASNSGVSRLQSWTRMDNAIVATLREPTRGVIEFRIQGTLGRSSETDTMLPIVGVADAQILESTLDLSAEPRTEAYIQSTGSAIPSVPMDIGNEAISNVPIRFSIQDESKPLIVRARPDQKLTADIAVLIYDIGGQPLMAQFLSLNTEGAFFDIPFRLRNDGYTEVIPYATRNNMQIELKSDGRDYTIPRADRENRSMPTILVVPHYIPPDGQQVLPLSVPDFDATLSITSHAVFDLRSESARKATALLPNWLLAAVKMSDLTEETKGLVVGDYDFDRGNQRFRIELFQESESDLVNTKRVISSADLHCVDTYDNSVVVGRSEFLVFSNDAGAVMKIDVPAGLKVNSLYVNRQARANSSDGRQISVAAPARLSHITLNWTNTGAEQLRGFVLQVPRMSGSETAPLVLIQRFEADVVSWSVNTQPFSKSEFSINVSDSLTRTLRAVNPAFRVKAGSEEKPALFGMNESFWQQLSSESPVATTSFRDALSELEQRSAGRAVRVMPSNGDLQIRILKMPSVWHATAVLVGLSTMLGCVVLKRRRDPLQAEAPETKTDLRNSASEATSGRPESK